MYHATNQIAENGLGKGREARRVLVRRLSGMKYGGSLVFITPVTVKLGVFTRASSPLTSPFLCLKHLKGQKALGFWHYSRDQLQSNIPTWDRSSYEHLSALTSWFDSFTIPHDIDYKTVNKLFWWSRAVVTGTSHQAKMRSTCPEALHNTSL